MTPRWEIYPNYTIHIQVVTRTFKYLIYIQDLRDSDIARTDTRIRAHKHTHTETQKHNQLSLLFCLSLFSYFITASRSFEIEGRSIQLWRIKSTVLGSPKLPLPHLPPTHTSHVCLLQTPKSRYLEIYLRILIFSLDPIFLFVFFYLRLSIYLSVYLSIMYLSVYLSIFMINVYWWL